ncbi:hypothetical protein KKE87_02350 [Patescibacteria group bacterium]|nr:hypothetical protein [Patescibacteria group bacterium]MBU1934056.1 hypothetical protein [Patescibacteria group bacterium]
MQKTKANSENLWSLDVKNINQKTFDLSVKNPGKGGEVVLRKPGEILEKMKNLDEESAVAMANIFKFIK